MVLFCAELVADYLVPAPETVSTDNGEALAKRSSLLMGWMRAHGPVRHRIRKPAPQSPQHANLEESDEGDSKKMDD